MHRLGRTLLLAVACTLVAACTDGDDPVVTVPRSSSTTSTTIDITTVPDTITVAYAQAVMDELDRVLGDAIRELVAAGEPSDRFVALLKAVYDEPQYSKEAELYGEDAAKRFPDYKNPTGDPATTVVGIVDSEGDCLVVEVRKSYEAVFATPPTAESTNGYIELRRRSGEPTPTVWIIRGEGPKAETELTGNPCAS